MNTCSSLGTCLSFLNDPNGCVVSCWQLIPTHEEESSKCMNLAFFCTGKMGVHD